MTQRTRTYLKYTFSAVLTILFLYLAFRGTRFEDLYASMAGANYWWILAMFACLMISHLLRSWRWRYLLNPIKEHIRFRNLFSGLIVGYMMNNVLPRAGEIVRPYTIGKLESIPASAAFGTIVVERLMDTTTFLILIVLMPVLYQGPLRDTFPWLEQAGILLSCFTCIFLALAVTLMLRRDWTDALLRVVGRILPQKVSMKIESITHSFLDGFLFLTRPSSFLIIMVLSILVWGFYVVMTYLAFFAFRLEYIGIRGAVVVLAISSIGVAIPTPGATGSYHVFTSQTLTQLFGVSKGIALSYATSTHAVGFIGVTFVGLYYFWKDHIRISEAVRRVPER
jgi:uncharacterized protein (TIRG00374 family)